jgi:hypothetical protein
LNEGFKIYKVDDKSANEEGKKGGNAKEEDTKKIGDNMIDS